MANVLLTQKCVRACPYCFAKNRMDKSADGTLSWENLIYVADLLKSSGEEHISLLGGEPTLHPNFTDFIAYLLERNFNVTVFTCGIMTDKMLSETCSMLSGIDPRKFMFVCNLNEPGKSPFAEVQTIRRFLLALGHITIVGYNIYSADFKMDFIFDYINQFGMRRAIRLGLANPIFGDKNLHIKIDEMQKIISRIVYYLPTFERLRIKPGLDCGFPLCLFNDEELGRFYKVAGGNMKFGCGPAIDIGTDMSVWSCFPLASFHKKSIYEFNSIQETVSYFNHLHHAVRSEVGGIFDRCDDCQHREDGLCGGGCLAHTLKCFENEEHIRSQEIY